MDNLYKFLIALSGISLLLTICGFPTAINQVSTVVSSYTPFSLNGLYNTSTQTIGSAEFGTFLFILVGLVVAVLAAAIASSFKLNVGFVQVLTSADTIMAGFCGCFLFFAYDIVSMVNYATAQTWPHFVILVIYVIYLPLLLAYLFSIIKFWRTGV